MTGGALARGVGTAFIYVYMGLCYGFIFLPIGVFFLFSFQSGDLALPSFGGLSLRWYATAMADGRVVGGLLNSLLVGLLSSALSVITGFLAAYGMARYEFPAKRWFHTIIILPLAMSSLLVSVGLAVGSSALGVRPSLRIVVIGHVLVNMPLAFVICRAQLGEHQRKIEQAARDLGASSLRVLLTITVPVIAPALIVAFCLCFTLSWNEVIIADLNSRADAATLPVVIWSLLRGGLNPVINASGSIGLVCSIVLILAITPLLRRKRRP